MAYHGAHIAATAAAEKQRKIEEAEEEKMTKYNHDESEKWEYKIVRSESGTFRNPNVLAELVEDEALAGWEMLEKFDNRRIRFRRPVEARKRDAMLPDHIDPYRTNYGTSMLRVGVMLSLGLLMLGIFLFVFLMYRDVSGDPSLGIFPVISLIIGLVVFGLGVAVARARR
jgi:hypothetical protein